MAVKGKIFVDKAGTMTSIQGGNRSGYMQFGLAGSGPMDVRSARIANELVGNSKEAALLETTLAGLSLRFLNSCIIAITGADLGARKNGDAIDRYKAIPIKKNDHLSFVARRSGLRTYIAISGGIDAPLVMGSPSSHSMIDLGTQNVVDGTTLTFSKHTSSINPKIMVDEMIPVFSRHFTARVVPGPEFNHFSQSDIQSLSSISFSVSPDSNKMGYRLVECIKEGQLPKGIISSGTVPGTIQIPSSGKPIILLNDGPTTGGYARIGNIISADLDYISQLGPGDTLRFKWISFEEADRLLTSYWRNLKEALV